jgi:drug/metabolite transporter (DMT)-like permease
MVYVFLGAFLISFSSIFVKLAHVGPTTAMFYRFLFGFVSLSILSLIMGRRLWAGRDYLFLSFLGGLSFSLDLFFWHRCIHYVGPGLATILANLQVFSLAAVGILWLGEKPDKKLFFAAPTAFLGLFMLIGWDQPEWRGQYAIGIIFGIITAVCYTGVTLSLRAAQVRENRLSPETSMAWVFLFGTIFAGLAVYPSGEDFAVPDVATWTWLLLYGVMSSALGWALISTGLPRLPASKAGLTLILQPTLAFIWDIVLFERPTSAIHALGAGITLFAIYLGAVRGQKEKK